MSSNPEFKDGETLAVAFGKKYSHSKIVRMKLIVDHEHPNGYLNEWGVQWPVRVIPVGEFRRTYPWVDRPRVETPNPRNAWLASLSTWGNFIPAEGFKISLPASVQQ
jgi:hypothetical protein